MWFNYLMMFAVATVAIVLLVHWFSQPYVGPQE